MSSVDLIVTHPGGAHKDDFLACSVMLALHEVGIERRDPTPEDLESPAVCVIDVGHLYEPDRLNFDHHQFPRDQVPTCSLSLVLQYLDKYQDAQRFCDWLEPAEWFDCRGPKDTAEFLGVQPDIINKLNSPIDLTLLRRFALCEQVVPGQALWEIMKLVGEDLLDFLETLRARVEFVGQHAEHWELEKGGNSITVVFLPRTDPLPAEPSMGLVRYVMEQGHDEAVMGLVYPDRRGEGYGLSRYKDHPGFDFTRIDTEADVHFAHKKGFVAKTSANERNRLKELLQMAWQSVE